MAKSTAPNHIRKNHHVTTSVLPTVFILKTLQSTSQVTIIDTPELGGDPEDGLDMLDAMVKHLKDEIKFIDVFLIAFKESDAKITRGMQAHLRMLSAMFGPKFWNNVIVGATLQHGAFFHEQQETETEEDRLSNMDLWKNNIKEQFILDNDRYT